MAPGWRSIDANKKMAKNVNSSAVKIKHFQEDAKVKALNLLFLKNSTRKEFPAPAQHSQVTIFIKTLCATRSIGDLAIGET